MATTSKNGAAARTRSVRTKLTGEEFARLESLAATSGQSVSEWARSALLTTTAPTKPNDNQNQDAVLGEVRALRAIVLNLFYELANGEQVTVERMKEIIATADADSSQIDQSFSTESDHRSPLADHEIGTKQQSKRRPLCPEEIASASLLQ